MHALGVPGEASWMHAPRAGVPCRSWRKCTRARSARVTAIRAPHGAAIEEEPLRASCARPIRCVSVAGTFKAADMRGLPQTGTLPRPRRALEPELGIERMAPSLACPPPTPLRCTSGCLQSGTPLIARAKSSSGRRARPDVAEPTGGRTDIGSCRVARRRPCQPVHHPRPVDAAPPALWRGRWGRLSQTAAGRCGVRNRDGLAIVSADAVFPTAVTVGRRSGAEHCRDIPDRKRRSYQGAEARAASR
jgi:hypothetical protein